MNSPYETLLVDTRPDGIVIVTINRPERANSMTATMFEELSQVASDITADPSVRCVVLTGSGTVFCAGFDLEEAAKLPDMTAIGFLDLQESGARALHAVRALRVPVIAAVNGAAAGGGMSLALAADIRIASPAAKFNAAFVRIGLSAGDLGTSWLLPRLVGPALAAEIAFTGRIVPAAEAERIGLVNAVSAEGEVVDDALAMASLICANSPAGVELSKRALQSNLEVSSYAAAMDLENRGQTLLTRSPDMAEALAAFTEKRPPIFAGR
jgi:enoyl-CoA hydratase/carnithine racemase